MNFKQRFTSGGIVLLSDDGKLEGIHPRWGRVYSIGADQTEVKVDQWVLISHGRWTNGIQIEEPDGTVRTIRRVDNNDILAVSDEEVIDENMGIPLTNEQRNGAPSGYGDY